MAPLALRLESDLWPSASAQLSLFDLLARLAPCEGLSRHEAELIARRHGAVFDPALLAIANARHGQPTGRGGTLNAADVFAGLLAGDEPPALKPLTPAMLRALQAAADREDGALCPVPGLRAAAERCLVVALRERGLAEDRDGVPVISNAGRAALGSH